MILFLDTNILIEFVEKRRYSEIVFAILDRCSKSDCHLYMSVGGFYTITYLIDRHLKQEGKSNPERLEELKSILKFILTICDVASLSKESILSCLNGNEFVDLRLIVGIRILCPAVGNHHTTGERLMSQQF